MQLIIASRAVQLVFIITTIKLVGSFLALKEVLTVMTTQNVIALTTRENISTRAATDVIIPFITKDSNRDRCTGCCNRVIALASMKLLNLVGFQIKGQRCIANIVGIVMSIATKYDTIVLIKEEQVISISTTELVCTLITREQVILIAAC
ncbi:hypothetical protein PsAD46_01364 [Pseudovibrio sp. Ad46]|nr:hypothetical protein PsAD46_01364 [Pseudovibrio sp. Ad46]